MDSISAFAMGEANRGQKLKVFDWAKAAQLIRDTKPNRASAGLSGDWDWTGGAIYTCDGPVAADDTYTYLASTWATPQLDRDGDIVDCWLYQEDSPGWDSKTYWPDEATAILMQPLEEG